MQTISEELLAKDQEKLTKKMEACDKLIKRSNDKPAMADKEILTKVQAVIDAKLWIKDEKWSLKEIEVLNECLFLTAKPVIYLVNIGDG